MWCRYFKTFALQILHWYNLWILLVSQEWRPLRWRRRRCLLTIQFSALYNRRHNLVDNLPVCKSFLFSFLHFQSIPYSSSPFIHWSHTFGAGQPSRQPTRLPSVQPSNHPSSKPTGRPTRPSSQVLCYSFSNFHLYFLFLFSIFSFPWFLFTYLTLLCCMMSVCVIDVV